MTDRRSLPPKPKPSPFGEPLPQDSDNRFSIASENSRQSLRRDIQLRRASLTTSELTFLEELCINGNEIEVKLAHQNLLDPSVFDDDCWQQQEDVIRVGKERSQSLQEEGALREFFADESMNNHSTRLKSTGSEVSAPSMGSERRQELLDSRRRENLLAIMWKAHQNGLALSDSASRRSLLVRRSSLGTSLNGSSTASSVRREMFLRASKCGDIFRARRESSLLSRRASLERPSRGGRHLSVTLANTAEQKNARFKSLIASGSEQPLPTLKKPQLRRLQSDVSRKSVTFGDLPPPRRPSVLSDGDKSSEEYRQVYQRSESIGSIPSIHLAHSIRSPSTSSVGSFPSLHLAHHIRSQSFRSSSGGTMQSDGTPTPKEDRDPSDDEKKQDEHIGQLVETITPVGVRPPPFGLHDIDDALIDATPVTSHKTSDQLNFRRPVLMRDASKNLYNGEGIEVADLFETTHALKEKPSPLQAARRMDSLVSFGESTFNEEGNSVHSLRSIRRADSFDEAMSYGRISSIFRRSIRRSISDDDLAGIFLGGSRVLLHETSSLREVKPTDGTTDSWMLEDDYDEDDEYGIVDPWKVLEDEYENGYGGAGTLPFCILGTSAEDTDSHPHVLSPPLMESLLAFVPLSQSGHNMWMKYSLVRDGAAMYSFLQHARGSKYTFLAIETVDGEVFGAFTTEPWRKNWNFFGGGESFLWRLRHNRREKSASIIDQAQKESEIDVYTYTGDNNCIQLCTTEKIAIGGGDPSDSLREFVPDHPDGAEVKDFHWGFGITLANDLLTGTSSPCVTFCSPSLSKIHSDGSEFEVMNLELWTLTPFATVEDAEKLELGKLFLEENRRH